MDRLIRKYWSSRLLGGGKKVVQWEDKSVFLGKIKEILDAELWENSGSLGYCKKGNTKH